MPDGYTDADGRRQVVISTSAGVSVGKAVTVSKEATPSLKDPEFGGRGAGGDSIAEDTAAFAAFMASDVSAVLVPKGDYRPTGQIATPTAGRKTIKGQGGIQAGVGGDVAEVADTVIRSSYNGSVFRVATGHAVVLEDLMIYGDPAATAQVLMDIGDTGGAAPTSKFSMKRVHLKNSGRDCLQIRGLVLESEFEHVYCHIAGRYPLHAIGNQINALTFRCCLFREGVQHGARVYGGQFLFDTCVFESNSQHGSIAYGGMLLGNGFDQTIVNMVNSYFENNGGFNDTGPPWEMGPNTGTWNDYVLNEFGTFYSETAPCEVNAVALHNATGISTSVSPFVIHAAGSHGGMYSGCRNYGAGDFVVNSADNNVIVFDPTHSAGPYLQLGNDRYIQRNPSTGYIDTNYLAVHESLTLSKVATFAAIAAASAPINSLFKDSADGKLKFKDNGGVVNALY